MAILGTLALLAAVSPATGVELAPSPSPQLLAVASPPIAAFAQDGRFIAWIERGGRCGGRLRIRELGPKRTVTVPRIACAGSLANELALAGGRALWRADDASITNTKAAVVVRSAAFDDPRIRSTNWLVEKDERTGRASVRFPLAGDGSLLVYYAQDDEEEWYAVWRARVGTHRKVFNVDAPADLAVRGGRIAFVRTLPSVGEVRSADGRRLASFTTAGTPLGVALAASTVAVLTKTPRGAKQVEAFDARTGAPLSTAAVPATTSVDLAASDRLVVFAAGPTIRAVDVRTGARRLLARTEGTPIGLSLSGRRLAWAENRRGGRIYALTVPR